MSYLVFEGVPSAELLAVKHASGMALLEFLETVDVRHIGHPIMPARHNNGVEPLYPPVVEPLPTLPERDLPFAADLLDSLHCRVVLHEVLVTVSVY